MHVRFDMLHMVFLPDSDQELDPMAFPSGDANGRPHDVRKLPAAVAEPRHPASTSHIEPVRRRGFSVASLFDASVGTWN